MYTSFQLPLLLLSGALHLGSAATLSKRQSEPSGSIPFAQFTTPASTNIDFRFAVPSTASANAPFDIFLQVTAPKAQGWAGIAWGGSMTYNPLLVAWPYQDGVVASSRFSATKSDPAAYPAAHYRIVSSHANATHWEVASVCSGCSHWSEVPGEPVLSVPVAGSATLAWAASTRPIPNPASNTSATSYHNSKGLFLVDLGAARVGAEDWARLVAQI
ncbi:hypothetical protein PspLS_10256 [Pyricularia sp. CBS 133598]|nr:hypothetical protein PspLS_10256 [Pyricularia sp. CBS 133598]